MEKLFSARTRAWFKETLGEPTAVQRAGWPAIASGGHVLISAPTGTGKTLTAFLWHIDRLNALADEGRLEDKVYVLYITPLKALGNDIRENLRRPIEGMNSALRTAVRNGDTPAEERRRMLRLPPHILITTPESLFLLLTSQSGRRLLQGCESVILDEFHALAGTKRGAHLMVSLSRLDALCKRKLPRVALSATIEAEAALLVADGGQPVAVVAPETEKKRDVTISSPVPDMRVLPEKTIWPEIARGIHELAQKNRTVLVFCQGRATCEKVANALNEMEGEGFCLTHHGSVSKERRLEAERALKGGSLKVLCATSSMELGIDVGEVDVVVQVAYPEYVSSAMQRLGRAGHRPGEVSRMRFFPRTEHDVLQSALIIGGMREQCLEPLKPPKMALDVLSQQLVSMAVADEYSVDWALALLADNPYFEGLSRPVIERVLCMLAGDYERDADRPAAARLDYDRANGIVRGTGYSRMLALSSGGTIPDRGLYAAVLEDGTRLGELDEEFVFEARVGDRFLLGAFAWEIQAIGRDRVFVRACDTRGAQSPFWRGEGMGRAWERGLYIGRKMAEMERAWQQGRLSEFMQNLTGDEDSALNGARLLADQFAATGALPTDRRMLVEHFADETGDEQLLVHSIFGGQVNTGLGMLLKDTLERLTQGDVKLYTDDDGILLRLGGGAGIPSGLVGLLSPENAIERLHRLLPASPLFSMCYRYNAYRALIMGARSGSRLPLWVQRIRGAESFARAMDFPGHPLIEETLRECENDYLNLNALREVLLGLRSGAIAVLEMHTDQPSPLALPLRRQVEAELMYDYAPTPARAAAFDPNAIPEATLPPEESLLREAASLGTPPKDEASLHTLLLNAGDLSADELDVPFEWMESLERQGRAIYTEQGLWIPAEYKDAYRAALEEGDREAQKRLVLRCGRFHAPVTADSLAQRYQWEEGACQALLEESSLSLYEGAYYHESILDRARRMTISARRRQIHTAPGEAYAALLMQSLRQAGTGRDRLAGAISSLMGLSFPLETWEEAILPARAAPYRPEQLGELLSSGLAVWRITSFERTQLAFYAPDAIDWDAPVPAEDLTEGQKRIYDILLRRGASFTHVLAAALPQLEPLKELRDMARKGVVACDSLSPLREEPKGASVRQRVRGRAALLSGGRWELARAPLFVPVKERLSTVFSRWRVVCRETVRAEGLAWPEALGALRAMEYAGHVRRGYFVKGLSGAQFVRTEEFEGVVSALEHPTPDLRALCALDPMQPYGALLPMPEERRFLRVAGTVVVLRAGEIALLLEKSGAALRLFSHAGEAVVCLAQAFKQGEVLPRAKKLTVREYPSDAVPFMEAAGFYREMSDYVLWR